MKEVAVFSACYGVFREKPGSWQTGMTAHENHEHNDEERLQKIWQQGLWNEEEFRTHDGRALRIISPGWWNRGEGPDFKNAQLEIHGKLITGDVEIHWKHTHWNAHGHHTDPRYNNVILVVVTESDPPKDLPRTSKNKPIPCLLLNRFIPPAALHLSQLSDEKSNPEKSNTTTCCKLLEDRQHLARFERFLRLAGEWRMLHKANLLQEDMERYGEGQATYECFMRACGYSRYKNNFHRIARHLPYDRARQLALQSPNLLEAAFFQIAGLLPTETDQPNMPEHLRELMRQRESVLGGLKKLLMDWPRYGVRPPSYPERRLAGAACVITRTANDGLHERLKRIWSEECSSRDRRRLFEKLFPPAAGFWAYHYSWASKTRKRALPLFGKGRILSLIGNVFVPHALALARMSNNRIEEEKVFDFFAQLPQEPVNTVYRAMIERFWGKDTRPKIDFRIQQGLMQIHHDWCERNPSCRNCPVLSLWTDSTL